MRLPTSVTVARDIKPGRRFCEQKPLVFPTLLRWWTPDNNSHMLRVVTRDEPLETADYLLWDDLKDYGVLERKGSMRECHNNFNTADLRRQLRSFERMTAWPHRAIMMDFPIAEAWRCSKHVPHPGRVLDAVFRECERFKISLLWVPPGREPRHSGEIALRWLLSCAWNERWGKNGWRTRSVPQGV